MIRYIMCLAGCAKCDVRIENYMYFKKTTALFMFFHIDCSDLFIQMLRVIKVWLI